MYCISVSRPLCLYAFLQLSVHARHPFERTHVRHAHSTCYSGTEVQDGTYGTYPSTIRHDLIISTQATGANPTAALPGTCDASIFYGPDISASWERLHEAEGTVTLWPELLLPACHLAWAVVSGFEAALLTQSFEMTGAASLVMDSRGGLQVRKAWQATHAPERPRRSTTSPLRI